MPFCFSVGCPDQAQRRMGFQHLQYLVAEQLINQAWKKCRISAEIFFAVFCSFIGVLSRRGAVTVWAPALQGGGPWNLHLGQGCQLTHGWATACRHHCPWPSPILPRSAHLTNLPRSVGLLFPAAATCGASMASAVVIWSHTSRRSHFLNIFFKKTALPPRSLVCCA